MGCVPIPSDITVDYLINIAKAIGQCFVGLRKKLYETIAKDLYALDLLYKPILEIESEMNCSGVPEPSIEDCLNGKKLEFKRSELAGCKNSVFLFANDYKDDIIRIDDFRQN